ncbi:MAG: SRPBCC domain-containing protein [Actinoallomurus sp.]
MELDHEFTVPVPVGQAWSVLLDIERIAPCMPGATLDSVDGDEFTGRLKVKLGAMTITYKGSARIASQDESAHTVSIEGTGKEARGSGTASATVQAQLHPEGERTRVTVHTKLNITGRPAQFGRNIMAEVGGKLIGRFADNLAAEITSPTEPAGTAESDRAEAAGAVPAKTTDAAGAAEGAGAAEAEPQAAPTETATGDGARATAPPTARSNGDEASTETAPAQPSGDGTPKAAEATPAQIAPVARKPATPRSSDDDAINLLEFAGPSVAKRLAPVVAGLAALWALRRLIRRKRH